MCDPYLVVTGDVNTFDISEGIADYPDVTILPTPPTRGTATLDIIATNINHNATVVTARRPLESCDGKLSDHNVMLVESKILNSTQIDLQNRQFSSGNGQERPINVCASGLKERTGLPWTDNYPTANEKAYYLVRSIDDKMDEIYPIQRRVIKSTDAPGMSPFIKRRIKSRKKERDEKACQRCKEILP